MEETKRISSSPVHRLREFIDAGRGEVSRNGTSAKTFISKRLGLKNENPIEIYREFLMVLTLVEQSQHALEASSNQMKAPCLSSLSRIGLILGASNLDQAWQHTNSKIAEADIDLLKIGETILEQDGYELLLFENEIHEFETSISEVASEINTSELPDEVKATLADLLNDISTGLQNYDRYGLDGLKESLATAYGKVVLESATISPYKNDPPLVKLWSIIKEINTAISIVGKSSAAGRIASDAIDRILGS